MNYKKYCSFVAGVLFMGFLERGLTIGVDPMTVYLGIMFGFCAFAALENEGIF